MKYLHRLKSYIGYERILALMILCILISSSMAGPIVAQTVLQGYSSDQPLQKGMLVKLKKGDNTKLEALTKDSIEQMQGVVVDSAESPVTITSDNRNIFIANSGRYEVLVSNENGKIKEGDYISGSSLDGVASKAVDTQSIILGRSLQKFEGGGDSIGIAKTKNGKTIEFARIQVDISIGKNPIQKIPDKDKVPDSLQKVTTTIAEKPVSNLRIYLALTVLVATLVIVTITLFSGVKGTLISIGRNPLSKGVIVKGLTQVLFVSMIIFITGLFGVYLLIRL